MDYLSIAGRMLEVDLNDGSSLISDLPPEMIKKVLGGRGASAWILYHNLKPATDPLGPDNILLLCSGFLAGTGAPASSRLHMGSKSPLSGLLGSSNTVSYTHLTLPTN